MNKEEQNTKSNPTLSGLGILPSPFHLADGQKIVVENHNKNCTHKEIDTLSAKGILNTIDFEILKLLAQYRYLNAHNITIALNRTLPQGYQKNDYKRNLRKLVKCGVLLRHAIVQDIENTDIFLSPYVVSSLRFYALSPGAYSYIAPATTQVYDRGHMSNIQVMESLAVSQSLVQLQRYYRGAIEHVTQNFSTVFGTHLLRIPARVQLSQSDAAPALDLYLLCIRNHPTSLQNVLKQLSLLFQFIDNEPSSQYKPMILLLVENLCDIPDIHHRILTEQEATPSSLYYITDTSLLAGPPFQHLYLCEEENMQYRIKQYSLTSKNEAPSN